MSAPHEPFDELVDYETGGMDEAQAAAFEERLFADSAGGSTREAAFVDTMVRIGQYLLPRGGWDIGSSKQRVDALIAAGLRVQIIDPEPSPTVHFPPIADDADIVVTVIRVDVRGFDAIDVLCTKPDGTELKTFRDVGCDPDSGCVYAVCEAPLARIATGQPHIRSRIIGTRDGQQHVLAEFDTLSVGR